MSEKKGHPIAAGKSSFDLVDARKVFAALDLRPESVLLDLACGAGRYALAAAPLLPRGKVLAVDLWEEGIASLRQEAERLGLGNVEAKVGDAGQCLPFEDGSVEVCLMATVLHDLIEDGTAEGALREVSRILKPGGRLVVVEFKKMDGPPGPPAAIRITPEETERILAPHGFTREDSAVEIGPFNYLLAFRR